MVCWVPPARTYPQLWQIYCIHGLNMSIEKPTGDYTRKNFGADQNLIALSLAGLLLASIIVGIWNNLVVNSKIADLGQTEYPLSAEYVAHLRGLENTPSDITIEPGDYIYEMQLGDSPVIAGRYRIIDGNRVTRIVTVNSATKLYAVADYTISGSVIKYSDIKGDKHLFSQSGSPLLKNGDSEFVELDGYLRLPVNGTAELDSSSGPLHITDERSVWQKIRSTHPLKITQNILMGSALIVLLYLFYRIVVRPTTKTSDKNNSTFEA